ncbi:MAG: glycosyltransferase family 39 protein [Anaerolineae bacterium]|nr:glycosyltransferase family 39 protein [Anaerolineae bacterium]
MNTSTAIPDRQKSDWLRYFIKRLPPDEALLKALEYRYFNLLDLPQPCLDLRDDGIQSFAAMTDLVPNSYAAIILSASKQSQSFAEEELRSLNRCLQPQGLLALTVGQDQLSAESSLMGWATRLMNVGFAIERWLPFFPITAYDQLRRQRSPVYDWAYALTGHYVLTPWDSAQANLLTRLHEIYTQTTVTDGAFMLIVARKRSHTAIDTTLPPPNPFTLAELTQIPNVIANSAYDAPVNELTSVADATAATQLSDQPAETTSTTSAFITDNPQNISPTTESMPFTETATTLSPTRRSKQRENGIDRFTIETAVILLVSAAAALGAALLPDGGWFAVLLWLTGSLGACAALYAFVPDGRAEPVELPEYAPQPVSRSELLVLMGILLLGLGLRLIDLDRYPPMLAETEALSGLGALRVIDGELTTPFAQTDAIDTAFASYLFSLPVQVFGRTTFSIRFLAAVIGMATIATAWIIGRDLWNRTVGLVAALLLAGAGFHIHISRTGAISAAEALIAFGAMGAIGVAWHTGRRRWWLTAGVCSGLGMHFAATAQLLPFMLILVAISVLVLHPKRAFELRHQLIAALLAAGIVALPRLVIGTPFPGANVPLSSLSLQALWVLLSGSAESAAIYQSGRPLLMVIVFLLFLFGIGMAIAHIRQMRYLVLLVSIVVALGAALVFPIYSSVLSILAVSLPAALLLAARALAWIWKKLIANSELGRVYTVPALMLIVLLIAAIDVSAYFGISREATFYRSPHEESGYRIAQYLNRLDGSWTAYLYGFAENDASDATVAYLSPQFDPATNLLAGDSTEWTVTATDHTVHIFAPELASEAEQLRRQIPGGAYLVYPDRESNPLFVVYEIGR